MSITEFGRLEAVCWDEGGIGDGDTGEDMELRLKRLLR
jgi:hypothetical protein